MGKKRKKNVFTKLIARLLYSLSGLNKLKKKEVLFKNSQLLENSKLSCQSHAPPYPVHLWQNHRIRTIDDLINQHSACKSPPLLLPLLRKTSVGCISFLLSSK